MKLSQQLEQFALTVAQIELNVVDARGATSTILPAMVGYMPNCWKQHAEGCGDQPCRRARQSCRRNVADLVAGACRVRSIERSRGGDAGNQTCRYENSLSQLSSRFISHSVVDRNRTLGRLQVQGRGFQARLVSV